MSDIVMWEAERLAAALAARRVSCVEVMGAYLDHIERVNPAFNALVALRDRQTLIAEAEAKDREAREWRAATDAPLPPLFGFPLAPKDLELVRGVPSTSGSPILKNFIPSQDSLMVARLRAAGAIMIGKSNTPEFGLGSHTYNPVYGATGNAYDPSRSAGGSSGGAAAALALRLLPVADGSDYGGSLRNPAGWNMVYGFRPGFGLAPGAGEDVFTPTMGVLGPMARSVPDLIRLLGVQAGQSPRAPFSKTAPPDLGPDAIRSEVRAGLQGVRIGWLGDFGGFAPHEAGVLEVCEQALTVMQDLGCTIEPVRIDFPLEPVWRAFTDLRSWHVGAALHRLADDPGRRALLKPEALFEIERGRALSAFDVAGASTVRTAFYNRFCELFEKVDFLVAPTAQMFAFPVEWDWPHSLAGETLATYHEWMKAVCLISMTGCPALAVPAEFAPASPASRGGAMGVQIIAPMHQEKAALRLALAYDEATEWASRAVPPVLGA